MVKERLDPLMDRVILDKMIQEAGVFYKMELDKKKG
jgi:hypothetical protein